METARGKVVGKAADVTPAGALVVVDDQDARHEIVDGSVEYVE